VTTQTNAGGNWDRLVGLSDVISMPLRKDYQALLGALKEDTTVGGITYLGFYRAPPATKNHHAHEGGLVQHLLEMWDLYVLLRDELGIGSLNMPSPLSRENVFRAIIHHDLHKASMTYILESELPWKCRYANLEEEDLMGPHDMKTLYLLSLHGIVLDPLMVNCVLYAEGGYSEIRPRRMSVLAKLVYCLDELSGNVKARIETGDLIMKAS